MSGYGKQIIYQLSTYANTHSCRARVERFLQFNSVSQEWAHIFCRSDNLIWSLNAVSFPRHLLHGIYATGFWANEFRQGLKSKLYRMKCDDRELYVRFSAFRRETVVGGLWVLWWTFTRWVPDVRFGSELVVYGSPVCVMVN